MLLAVDTFYEESVCTLLIGGAVKVSRSVLALTDSRPRIFTLLPPPCLHLSFVVSLREAEHFLSLNVHS